MFYFAEQRPKALDALAKGKNAVEDLGDNDILDRAAEFLGLYFYMQGLFPEAILHFERATLIFESLKGDVLHNLSAPFFLGYCATYLGEFNRAIGCLDCNWRLALERSNFAVAATIRAVLGTVLVVISKLREGFAHLEGAMADAVSLKNDLALYFARGGLAYGYFLEGRMADARLMLEKFIEGGTTSGIVRQYSSPWYLEMLFTLDRMGYEPLKGFTFHGEMERVMKEPNIHLHGVALRLQASLAMEKKETEARIQPMLEKSEGYLIQAGDPLQLAKTRLEMARLFLRQGDQEKARVLLKKARRGLAGDTDVFFPDELRFLLESKQSTSSDALNQSDLLQRFLTMMDQLFPNMDLETIFTRTVAATNRFFKAERGALFWLDDLSGRDLNLRAACNMTEGDIKSEDFQQYLDQIAKASNSKEPIVVRSKDAKPGHAASRAILCIPVEIQGKVKGVLYHDNSYLKDCFEELGRNQLLQLGQYVSRLVERIWNYREMTEGRNQWVTRDNMLIDSDGNQEFCAQSPKMTELLNKLESFSSSDASVLLLGETGVGKELLARRIQRLSARADGPFVIVDATSIPETLVESELFGYEKGAFTGADRRRIGRLELAHQGTLFIDEIAELSMATQTKLLRVLQEKTYTRIGGTKTRQSDFRLITATNRDLEEEILRGNFRQDLYFRINVISLTIPPLRDRPEDIELLAEHFLAYYIKKHNRFPFKLGAEDRKRLQAYQWPGNVRELKNVIERSVLLSGEGEFEMNLPTPSGTEKDHPFTDYPSMEELQRRYIQFIIDKTGGKIGGPDGAANLLGMKRTTLHARMKKLGL
jgi:transcriptional regulator with GAF, ATPase, and Fis domain